jgi:hypothetical protein
MKENLVCSRAQAQPSVENLNRLALFAGFQDWKDLRDAFHGDVDASINYEEDGGRHRSV